jgi:signal transduction histidine kinase
MDYVSAFAEDFLRTAGIRCRMDLPNTFPEMRVDAEMRYNLFLAIKEALNNIVKHARATEVWLRLRIGKNGFAIIIEDNGQGLPVIGMKPASADRLGGGAGLPNIEKRLAAIGGSCVVESVPGQGTRIELRVRINHPTSPVVAIGRAEEVAY